VPASHPTWPYIQGLPLWVESATTRTLELPLGEWTRKTTVVELHGRGETGVGEDVTYDAEEHGERFPTIPLEGAWTLASFSRHLGKQALFAARPQQGAFLDYRRWAFESAALDLAVRQAGTDLATVLRRKPQPVRFVSSTRAEDLDPWLALYPELRFKLDPTPKWDDQLIAKRAAAGNVDTVDFKGQYHGTPVDNPPSAELYAKIVDAFALAWVEDPALTPETREVLAPHMDRVTWDAPIHSWADVEALEHRPRCLNCKPSRFGALERLFEFYDRCEAEGIALYGGGQFELGPGRGQIQLLASLFHPDNPNDVAPGGYNGRPEPGLPTSPLEVQPGAGFRLAED
jgi:L-alanine-DL-glutamate epimerase-like enolase superfamily enzyme